MRFKADLEESDNKSAKWDDMGGPLRAVWSAPSTVPPIAIRSMGDRSRGLGWRRQWPQFGGRSWGHLGETARGRPATFGYQPITFGSPPLLNFAQIRLRKRVTIFSIHDQKRSYQMQGRELWQLQRKRFYWSVDCPVSRSQRFMCFGLLTGCDLTS